MRKGFTVLLLLAMGALASEDEGPALHAAARRGDLAGVHAALEESHIDAREHGHQGDSALHLAARAGHHEVVSSLLDKGASAELEGVRAAALPVRSAECRPTCAGGRAARAARRRGGGCVALGEEAGPHSWQAGLRL